MSPTDARGGETVVNTPKVEPTAVSLRMRGPSVRYASSSVCIWCVCVWVCVGVSTSVVSCTARCVTLGNLRNFHLGVGWGVGVRGLKREHRFAVNWKTDHMLLQSRSSAHLPVSSVTVTLPPRLPVACEYTAVLHYRQVFKFELVYKADGDGKCETLTMLYYL